MLQRLSKYGVHMKEYHRVHKKGNLKISACSFISAAKESLLDLFIFWSLLYFLTTQLLKAEKGFLTTTFRNCILGVKKVVHKRTVSVRSRMHRETDSNELAIK